MRRSISKVTVVLLALSAVLLSACAGNTGSVIDATAATVNGVEIPEAFLLRLTRAQVSGAEQRGEAVDAANTQRGVLSQMIVTEIIRQGANAEGLTVTEEEIDERLEQEAAFAGSMEALLTTISGLGFNESEARAQLEAIILQDKLAELFTEQAAVPDEDVRALFEQRGDTLETATTAHILVETEDEANEILALLQAGGDFDALAQERSIDTFSGEQGGDLGANARGQFVAEFDAAVWAASAGDLLGPIETEFGFHIIRVDSFETPTFADLEESLRAELSQGAVTALQDEFFQRVTGAAVVEVDSRYGVYDNEQNSVVAADPLDSDG